MATYYISGTGSDDNNGSSESQAFRTFDQVQKVLKAGDTVYVMNGTYTKDDADAAFLQIDEINGSEDQWTTIKAYPGHEPVLEVDTKYGIIISDSTYVKIEGLSLQGNRESVTLEYAEQVQENRNDAIANNTGIAIISTANEAGEVTGGTHHIVISGNKVQDFSGGGIGTKQADYVTIENNVVSGTSWYTSNGSQAITNLLNWNSDNNTEDYKMIIRNNIVYDNQNLVPNRDNGKRTEGNGIVVDTSNGKTSNKGDLEAYTGKTLIANNIVYNNGGSGINVYKSDNVDIVSNTTYGNAYGPEQPAEITVAGGSTNVNAYNNIMYASDGKAASYIGGEEENVNFDNNIAYNGNFIASDDPNATGLQNTVGQDPGFVNAENGNFNLKAGSIAVDAGGSDFNNVVSTDNNGNSRTDGDGINGVQTDIGALEYTGEPQLTPTTLFIAATDATKPEGDAGSTSYTFTVTRSGNTTAATTVAYAVTPTSGTSRVDAADFGDALPSGTLSFAAGETSKTLTFNAIGDTTPEGDESFTVTLSNPSGDAAISTATAKGTVQNDDSATLAITVDDAYPNEGDSGNSPATFTVTRSGDLSVATSATYTVSGNGDNPADADDFGGTFATGTVSFATGETSKTITVNISGDTEVEQTEGFKVSLSDATNGAVLSGPSIGGLIRNDDDGSSTPSPSPSPSPSPTPTPTPTSTPTPSPTPTPTSENPASTPTPSPTPTSENPVSTPTPSPTPTPSSSLKVRADTVTSNVDGSTKIDVLSNDRLTDNFTLTLVGQPRKGSAEVDNNGTPDDLTDDFILYTPNSGAKGKDAFSYQITTSDGGSVTGRVRVNLTDQSSTSSTVQYEAEDLSLSNYTVESFSGSEASGGKQISLRNTDKTSGKATGVFRGEAGTYQVAVGYYDENDGQSSATVTVDGQSTSFKFDQDMQSDSAMGDAKTSKVTHSAIKLESGDRFELSMQTNAGEFGRFDYVRFTPVGQSAATSSTAAGEANSGENRQSTAISRSNVTSSGKTLRGTDGDNTLKGGDGNDVLVGVPSKGTALGQTERDVLIGGKGSDTFQLGDETTVYYDYERRNDSGLRDYALIKDFSVKEGDVIVLHGEASDYELSATPATMYHKGIGIFHQQNGQSELIGVIEDQKSGLNLNSDNFKFV